MYLTGEIFGGLSVGKEENDAIVLMNALQRCCSCACHASGRYCHCCHQKEHISVPELLSTIKGPWSLIYWQVFKYFRQVAFFIQLK